MHAARSQRFRPINSMAPADRRMAMELRASLTAPEPWIPTKYLYDDRGSSLFEQITRLPEYYQTRTETLILEQRADAIIDAARPRELLELGSGNGRKIRLLLDAMQRAALLERCVLLDINELFVRRSVRALQQSYRGVEARGVVADFQGDLSFVGSSCARMVIFLAGTFGNLHPDDVPRFLVSVRTLLAQGGSFLVGVDLVKDAARLEAAYNDSAGITASFNLNVLQVINDRMGADLSVADFEHVASYDPEHAWIDIRLRAVNDVDASIPGADLRLKLDKGAEIRTEISCKYTRDSLQRCVAGSGLHVADWFSDDEQLFALALLREA